MTVKPHLVAKAARRRMLDGGLNAALDAIGRPDAATLAMIEAALAGELLRWFNDYQNRRERAARLKACGYVLIHDFNKPAGTDHLWAIGGKRRAVYAKETLGWQQQMAAAERLRSSRKS